MTKQEMKIGTKVILTDDFGKEHETVTRSEPWQLGHGDWVVMVDGRSGGYDLDRIRVIDEQVNEGEGRWTIEFST